MGIAISDSDGDPEEGDDPEDQVGNTEAVDTEAVDTFSLDDPIRMYLKEIGRIALSCARSRRSDRATIRKTRWATLRRSTLRRSTRSPSMTRSGCTSRRSGESPSPAQGAGGQIGRRSGRPGGQH